MLNNLSCIYIACTDTRNYTRASFWLCCLMNTEIWQTLKGLLRNANEVHASLYVHPHELFLVLTVNVLDYEGPGAKTGWQNFITDEIRWTPLHYLLQFVFREVLIYFLFFIFLVRQPLVGQGLLFIQVHDHTQTHHTPHDSSGRMISPTQSFLPDNTQHSLERGIHAPGGVRTRIPSNRGVAAAHFKPRGHC